MPLIERRAKVRKRERERQSYRRHAEKIKARARAWRRAQHTPVSEEQLQACRRDPRLAFSSAGKQWIICLECGERHKQLANHLRCMHDRMTSDQYRKKWGYNKGQGLVSASLGNWRSRLWRRRRHGRWLAGHRPTAAQLVASRGPRETRIQCRLDRRDRMAGKAQPFLWKHGPTGLVTDAEIAKLRLRGKEQEEIAQIVGLSSGSVVGVRLRKMGFPKAGPHGSAGLFLHGELLTGQRLNKLCRDFGMTKKQMAKALLTRLRAVYYYTTGAKKHRALQSDFAGRVIAVRQNLLTEFRRRGATAKGGRPRLLLPSEKAELPSKRRALRAELSALRKWLREQDGRVSSRDVWDWLCSQSRSGVMRTLLFWPQFHEWVKRSYDQISFHQGQWIPYDLAIQFLADEYGASEETIMSA